MSDEAGAATASQTVGPFFHFGLTPKPDGRLVDRLGGGEAITLVIRVTDGDGNPLNDALVEVVQDGVFGRMPTDEDGTCVFETIRPRVSSNESRNISPHLFVCLFARGLLRQLHTRIYFAGDPALDRDPVLALVPHDRRQTLLARPDPGDGRRWTFDLRLQGADETVFFAE
jgi:protocatechuate 3,4-dioxygenase, alpha subunit